MSEEQSGSAAEEAQVARQIGDIDQQIARLEDQVRSLESERLSAEATHKDAIQGQLAAVQRERLGLLQRVNTLRAQLDLPAVTPDAVPLQRRGAKVYPGIEVPEHPATDDR